MKDRYFRIFLVWVISVALFTALCFLAGWFFNIEIPRMRHETVQQQLYNRCLLEVSSNYAANADKSCAYILQNGLSARP